MSVTSTETGDSVDPGNNQDDILFSINNNLHFWGNFQLSSESTMTTTSSSLDTVASPMSLSTAAGSQISFEKDGENYKCTICNKAFGYKNGLIRHVRLTHDKERPFQCNICHRRFGYKNILLEHQNIHFGIKPYACNLCDKRFAARSNLVQHRLIHRKPFCCCMCNKRFDKEPQLQRHLLTCQGEALQCSICNYAASNQASLNKHIFDAHPPQYYDTRDRNRVGLDSEGINTNCSAMSMTNNAIMQTAGNAEAILTYSLQSNTETESMRKIDNICSQLASRSNSTTPSNDSFVGNANIKQEQPSPPYDSQPVFPVGISVANDRHNADTGPINSNNTDHNQFSTSGNSLDNMEATTSVSHSTGMSRLDSSNCPQSSPHLTHTSTPLEDMIQVIETPITPDQPVSSRSYTVSSPRDHGSGSTHQNNNVSADSTSSLSEMLSILQNFVQRSHDLESAPAGVSVMIAPKKQTRHTGTQISARIEGMPSLEDTLAYYVSQGKLYKCTHCGILFQERGMYFLHSSLHGTHNPWECSICHKECVDKNDFNLHFVNQQHA